MLPFSKSIRVLLLIGCLVSLVGCNSAPAVTAPTIVTKTPAATPPPNPALYPIAGQWHGGNVAQMAVYDRGTGAITYKFGDLSEGYIERGQLLPGGLPVAGDWDGDGRATPALYFPDSGEFKVWQTITATDKPDSVIRFGTPGRTLLPVTGDWNGDGRADWGTYDPATATFMLEYPERNYQPTLVFTFGEPGAIPVAGDWDGDGKWGVGVYDPAMSRFSLRNVPGDGTPDQVINFGKAGAGWLPIAGRWRDGTTARVGLFDTGAGVFHLDQMSGVRETTNSFVFGPTGKRWQPIAGDWDGDGLSTVGLFDPATAQFYLRNSNSTGAADLTLNFGSSDKTWRAVAGDWDGDGKDSVGLWESPLSFYLRNSNSSGKTDWQMTCAYPLDAILPVVGDWTGEGVTKLGIFGATRAIFLLCESLTTPLSQLQFPFGQPGAGWLPIAGDWDGDKKAGLGLYQPDLSRFHLSETLSPPKESATYVFGKANKGWLPIAGDWTGSGRDSVGLYDPAEGRFHLRVIEPSAPFENIFDLIPPHPDNPNLAYFGYYSADGFDYTVPDNQISQIAALKNSNVAHIHTQFEEYEIPHFKAALNDLRANGLRAILNIQWLFVRQVPNEKALKKADWRAEFDRYKPILDSYQDTIAAFYFDEPLELGLSAADFKEYTKALRTAYPTIRVIVVESASQIINENLTADYLKYATDIGIDLYYTDPTYLSAFGSFHRAWQKMRADYPDKQVWFAVDGYTRRGSTVRDLIDAFDLYYSLARQDQNAVGMLVFLWSAGNVNFAQPTSTLYQSTVGTDGALLRDLHVAAGTRIMGKAK